MVNLSVGLMKETYGTFTRFSIVVAQNHLPFDVDQWFEHSHLFGHT